MTTLDPIETRLLAALAADLSTDDLRRLDERVGRAMARPASRDRHGMPSIRWLLRPLPLLAALAMLGGSVMGAAGLLDQLVESPGMPGWRTAWEQAERLDLEQTDSEVTITLVRAYADRNQVLVGFTVAGLVAEPTANAAEGSPLEWTAELRDPLGRPAEAWATVRSGSGIDTPELSASVDTWEGRVEPVAGTWVLTFTSVGRGGGAWTPGECAVGATDPACGDPPADAMIEGSWRFEFDLPAPAGIVLTPEASVTEKDATMTLTELRISATQIAAGLALRVDGNEVEAWSSDLQGATVRRDDLSFAFGTAYHVTQSSADRGPHGDAATFQTAAGPEDPAGSWTIEIPEIWYTVVGDDTDETRLTGPWTFTVDVP